ncbi:MAG: DUF503 domain-containing protein [Lentisphaerae bacterium]|nr:DUF503 domain-containing protein [Lentisphaerota bacterium]
MTIGLVTARISIPGARSLKDKRAVVRSLKDRVLKKMNVSVAEVGEQAQWRSAELAFVTVAADALIAQSRMADISSFLRSTPRFVLVDLHTEML